jgi:hypothetical protein
VKRRKRGQDFLANAKKTRRRKRGDWGGRIPIIVGISKRIQKFLTLDRI